MTRKSVGLLSMAVACAAVVSISASSCDNSNPATPGTSQNNGGKGPRVLDGPCGGNIGSTDCGIGPSAVSYDEGGNMRVSNMNGAGTGVRSVFAAPINYWNASVDVEFPPGGNGFLTYSAQDATGSTQAQMTISQAAGGGYMVRPAFTSSPGGGTQSYDIQILDARGNVVASQPEVPLTQATMMMPNGPTFPPSQPGWGVTTPTAQCIWSIRLASGASWVLPNGTAATGTTLKMTERNSLGVYPYVQSGIIVSTGVATSYTQRSASGVQVAQQAS